ncbi:MAG: phosphonate C-P lyase system protein PhnH [Roseiflexaceae bacterium]|nr:phosphonate C-P lyase system protein PhnH [Roseiflexus sp.]MDW8214732.1 phosphonate C-P lyase system protein PhnH [Roseiflexaceae bacterium]
MTTIVAAPPTPLELFNGRTFRVLLDCLARPGRVGQLPVFPLADLPRLPDGTPPNPTAVAACMSLLDQTVSFAQAAGETWMSVDHPLTRWIALRSNAHPVAPEAADFALLHDPAGAVLLGALKQGTLLCPEQSCTAFLCVPEIVAGGAMLRLTGPGIAGEATVGLPGVAPTALEALIARRGRFPLGIDIFLIDRRGYCLGLPRTTQVAQACRLSAYPPGA